MAIVTEDGTGNYNTGGGTGTGSGNVTVVVQGGDVTAINQAQQVNTQLAQMQQQQQQLYNQLIMLLARSGFAAPAAGAPITINNDNSNDFSNAFRDALSHLDLSSSSRADANAVNHLDQTIKDLIGAINASSSSTTGPINVPVNVNVHGSPVNIDQRGMNTNKNTIHDLVGDVKGGDSNVTNDFQNAFRNLVGDINNDIHDVGKVQFDKLVDSVTAAGGAGGAGGSANANNELVQDIKGFEGDINQLNDQISRLENNVKNLNNNENTTEVQNIITNTVDVLVDIANKLNNTATVITKASANATLNAEITTILQNIVNIILNINGVIAQFLTLIIIILRPRRRRGRRAVKLPRVRVLRREYGKTIFKKMVRNRKIKGSVYITVDQNNMPIGKDDYRKDKSFGFIVENKTRRPCEFYLFPQVLAPAKAGFTILQRDLVDDLRAEVLEENGTPVNKPRKFTGSGKGEEAFFYVRLNFLQDGKMYQFQYPNETYYVGLIAIAKERYNYRRDGRKRMDKIYSYRKPEDEYQSFDQYEVIIAPPEDTGGAVRAIIRGSEREEGIAGTEIKYLSYEREKIAEIINDLVPIHDKLEEIDPAKPFRAKEVEDAIIPKDLEEVKQKVRKAFENFDAVALLAEQRKEHDKVKKDINKQYLAMIDGKSSSFKRSAKEWKEHYINTREDYLTRLEFWVMRVSKRVSAGSIIRKITEVQRALTKNIELTLKAKNAYKVFGELLKILKETYDELGIAYRKYEVLLESAEAKNKKVPDKYSYTVKDKKNVGKIREHTITK